jgi:tripeptidyl-peptidase II
LIKNAIKNAVYLQEHCDKDREEKAAVRNQHCFGTKGIRIPARKSTIAMGDKPTSITFPTEGILPKTETGAAQFVEKYPTWDGRGVVVAIFDTGVDPGAAGLQITSDGKPKIIDVVDCTGSGDIEMSEVREIKEGDTSIVGLSGRTLKIGKWSCPSGKVFLGIKRVYELFPRGLVKRVKEERLESFTESHRSAESVIQQKLNALEQQESNKTEAYKREKKDIEALISALAEQMEQYSDSGPAIDCLVFFDGSKWRAVVDSNCSGDLTSAQLLTNFRCHPAPA